MLPLPDYLATALVVAEGRKGYCHIAPTMSRLGMAAQTPTHTHVIDPRWIDNEYKYRFV
jgi:hypothetical protein